MDFTLTIGNIVALLGFLFTVLTAIVGVWWKMHMSVEEAKQEARHKINNVEMAAEARVRAIEKELNDFRIHAVSHFATWEALNSIDSKLVIRIDDLQTHVMNMPDLILERISRYINLRP
jgi:hypothetical protein